MSNEITITDGYRRVFQAISEGVSTILVSGEAGSGKSVLIGEIEKRYRHRNIVKVAPTGISALNIGATTIHSLFRLPLGLLTEQNVLNTVSKLYKTGGAALLQTIDLLIIEEISMVRADTIDAVNTILRRIRRSTRPFGGVQVVLVGDLFQLPPVLVEDERDAFELLYDTTYFFSSNVMRKVFEIGDMQAIILDKVFRQKDEHFVSLLNNVRVNRKSRLTTKILNDMCFYDPLQWEKGEGIVLCTTNISAQLINETELRQIDAKEFVYEATVSGYFNQKIVTPAELRLKVGARVMFTKNDPSAGYVNGSMGTVKSLSPISADVVLDDGGFITVYAETWEIVKLELNQKTKMIEERVTGSFRQLPLTLAWAITIHKSQGLSFDNVTVDLGSNAFAYGQVYVALSRCRSLDGLKLLRAIEPRDIKVDPEVSVYYKMLIDTFGSEDDKNNDNTRKSVEVPMLPKHSNGSNHEQGATSSDVSDT